MNRERAFWFGFSCFVVGFLLGYWGDLFFSGALRWWP